MNLKKIHLQFLSFLLLVILSTPAFALITNDSYVCTDANGDAVATNNLSAGDTVTATFTLDRSGNFADALVRTGPNQLYSAVTFHDYVVNVPITIPFVFTVTPAVGTARIAVQFFGDNALITCPVPAQLTLVKTVTNDNGGTAVDTDFIPSINGLAKTWGTAINVTPGAVTVSETNLPGYLAGAWGGDCAADGSITLAPGQNATCTITNDDISPTITVVKTILNDNGRTETNPDAFTLQVDGSTVLHNAINAIDAGSHSVSEVGLPNYTAGAWGGDCAPDGSITLVPGQDAICTITNDDDPLVADLAVMKTDGNASYTPGEPFSYTITVTNNGPDVADGSVLNDSLPAWALGPTWLCTASGGAACPNAAGTGDINETIATFPNGGELVYTLTGTYSTNMADY